MDGQRVRRVGQPVRRVLRQQDVAEPVGDVGEVVGVDDHPAVAVGGVELRLDLDVGERDRVRPPDRRAAGPRCRRLDPVLEHVLGRHRLADGVDLALPVGRLLPPLTVGVPDRSALDLHHDDAGSVEHDGDVELVVAAVVGEVLIRDEQVVLAELLLQRAPHPMLRAVHEWRLGGPEKRHD